MCPFWIRVQWGLCLGEGNAHQPVSNTFFTDYHFGVQEAEWHVIPNLAEKFTDRIFIVPLKVLNKYLKSMVMRIREELSYCNIYAYDHKELSFYFLQNRT